MSKKLVFDSVEALTDWECGPAPCDEPPKGGGATAAPGRSPAGAVPRGQAPDLKALQAENDRLTRERDEACTEVTDMMWQRRRAEERAEAAEAALAESERKRGFLATELGLAADRLASAATRIPDPRAAFGVRTWAYDAKEALKTASTPTQETPDDQG